MSETGRRQQMLILAATSIGSVLNPLLASMITLALPAIGMEFSVSARDLGWMSTAFILANALCLVPGARFVDRFGYKKSYIIGSLVVSATCAFSIFAPDYTVLIALRVLAGCGISLVMITSLAILTRVFPKNKRGFIIGINTAMVYIGLSLGPVLGGVMTEAFGWQSLFMLMTPLVLCSAALLFFFLQQEFTEPVPHVDVFGACLYAAAVFCLMYGLSTITEWGSAFLAAAGVILLIVFVWFELRQAYPILNVRLFFTNKRFARSAYAALLNYAAVYGVVYFVSLYLQSVGRLTPTETGLIMLFQPLIQAVMTPVAGKISDRVDPKYLVTAGMSLTVAGVLLLAGLGLTPLGDAQYITITQVFIGLGAALFAAPNTSAIMGSVRAAEYSTASGIVAVVRQLGMLLSMAVCMASISFIVGGEELLGEGMHAEFMFAMRTAMVICAGFAVAGVFFSWFRGENPHTDE
ncbi:MAG: MFS transporter [Methanocorpusculum sp.]|nr:MFS transporter [Methanocorpusculum sp.]